MSSQREPLSVADLLVRAADLIEPAGAWNQGDFALTAEGVGVYGDEPNAICWCALGAIQHETQSIKLRNRAHFALLDLGIEDIPDWNDDRNRTQAEVVTKLREAATRARGEVL